MIGVLQGEAFEREGGCRDDGANLRALARRGGPAQFEASFSFGGAFVRIEGEAGVFAQAQPSGLEQGGNRGAEDVLTAFRPSGVTDSKK